MAKMYLVTGCSGVGKTTFSKKFAQEKGLLYLAPDDIYQLINGDASIRDNKFEVWITLFQAIHAAEVNGRDCIIDTNALTVNDRDQFLGWFPSFDHHWVYIEATPELRRQNNLQRTRHVPEEEMDRMSALVQPPRWGHLDKRWRSFLHIYNNNNTFEFVEQKGSL